MPAITAAGVLAFSALVSAGIGAATAAGAFAEDVDVPEFDDDTETKRRQSVIAAQSQGDRRRNILAGETESPTVSRSTLLGGSEVTGGS